MDLTEATNQSIKAINPNTVHKICSGQVVLSLAIAVKELVENSLDAGATSIDVRLKNYGMDLIEVSDNGCGVVEENFEALTLKYHTSKLNEYLDLMGVTSFGFRGEALSSLCALADLVVTTRHHTSEYATKVEYDHKGHIKSKTPCSRQVGTTVSLSNLFSSLPVRQKEFHKNAKREVTRMTQLLYAYCLVCVGVKITCTNQSSGNSKSIIVATLGSSVKDNITSVFGPKQISSLLELKPECVSNIKDNIFKGLAKDKQDIDVSTASEIEDVDIDLSEESNDADDSINNSQSSTQSVKSQGHKNKINQVEFEGFISSCAHGSGRSSTDRQFFYINSRPCEPTKIIKVINETYRQYNPNQYPFVFLNVNLERSAVDVNVTPDKRKVFLTKEKVVLEVLKASLLKVYENIPRTLKVEALDNKISKNHESIPEFGQPRIFNAFLSKFSSKSAQSHKVVSSSTEDTKAEIKRKSTTMLDYVSAKTSKIHNGSEYDKEHEVSEMEDDKWKNIPSSTQNDFESTDVIENSQLNNEDNFIDQSDNTKQCYKSNFKTENHTNLENNKEVMYLEFTDNLPNTQIREVSEVIEDKTHTIYCKTKKFKEKVTDSSAKTDKKTPTKAKIITDKDDIGKSNRKSVMLKTSLDHVKALLEIYTESNKESIPEKVKFRSEINPVFNKKCEEELRKEINKDSFKKMKVIGQFNLGFIITQLDDDLFIIDQHATDEIYNFETLQKNTELTSQKLVIPQQLELTGVNEQILMENLNIFKKNGFTFEINEEALPTKRVKLLTIPMSKNWVFGKEDIEELLFMLRESPSEYCRPSRVRAMFASRACRKSVMIGTALAKADMKTLVEHMAEIDQPWNCPHGRPTIRHLVNMAMTSKIS